MSNLDLTDQAAELMSDALYNAKGGIIRLMPEGSSKRIYQALRNDFFNLIDEWAKESRVNVYKADD